VLRRINAEDHSRLIEVLVEAAQSTLRPWCDQNVFRSFGVVPV
jgi:hypothetical protein